MATVAGTGLLPLLQWIIVPIATMALDRLNELQPERDANVAYPHLSVARNSTWSTQFREEPAISRIQSEIRTFTGGKQLLYHFWPMLVRPSVHGQVKPEQNLAAFSDSLKDEVLVRSALAGDRGAFDRLVERYGPRMFRMIRAEVRDASEAEDLVQEIFLRAMVALPQFRFDARFFTWLYRIMFNTVRQHQRNGARRRELDAKVHRNPEPGMAADILLEKDEARERVRHALAGLPQEYRTALLLREWENQTYAQIAEVLGCPPGTVASRIARARQMLAERLGPECEHATSSRQH